MKFDVPRSAMFCEARGSGQCSAKYNIELSRRQCSAKCEDGSSRQCSAKYDIVFTRRQCSAKRED